MKFTKMHGCGNDYIYIDGASEHVPGEDKPELARRLSDRHFGIGSDGLIFINPSDEPDVDFEMEMYNADGSGAEMCGNGIRCVGAYAFVRGLTDKKDLTIISAGAKKYLTLDASCAGSLRTVSSVTVDMGAPILAPADIPMDKAFLSDKRPLSDSKPPHAELEIAGRVWDAACVSMGNPHAVVLLPDDMSLDTFAIEDIGSLFETHPAFPNRINTEFVRIDDRRNVSMRVWERGTGETLACGTGCCAIAAALALDGLTEDEMTIHVRGGELICRLDREKMTVFMTGPATFVFDGEL